MSIFENQDAEIMARKLCEVMYMSNSIGYCCGQSATEVYGGAYNALKRILEQEFGKYVATLAMSSKTWCVSNFDGQVIPAIEWAIQEHKEMILKEANGIISLLREVSRAGSGAPLDLASEADRILRGLYL